MNLSNLAIDHLAQVGLETALIAEKYISSQVGKKHPASLKAGTQSLATQVVTAIDIKSQ